ncbi:MAG TPA: hypothetical protein VIM58_11895 [Candidatus Methylacidiphilales bacterium]
MSAPTSKSPSQRELNRNDPGLTTGAGLRRSDLPQAGSWNAMPGSTGRRADEVPPEDEDPADEGRGEAARLVEEGVDRAEDDLQRRGRAHGLSPEQ